MWIHEHQNWTDFTWDAQAVSNHLADLRHRQGRLIGHMESLGFELKQEAHLYTLTSDVVKSSAIEGEHLNPTEVRSSIAQRLGMDVAGISASTRDVDGIVEMMIDATHKSPETLTKQRLFDWHCVLFPTERSGFRRITVGKWRTGETGAMRVISGPVGHESIHFEAPAAERLEDEMQIFLKWFNDNQGIDPIIKAGIAHFWFVTIHPFEDGNGRIARAISDMALARADGVPQRFYSMSSQIEVERKDYYNQLERQQRGTPNLTKWLEWFLGCLNRSISHAEESLSQILLKSRLWTKLYQSASKKPPNDRQSLVINRMFEEDFKGHMNTSKYAKLAKCSTDTALRDIQDLLERWALIQNSGKGRSTSYRLPRSHEI